LGGDVVAVGGKVAMMPISLGTADFMVHHIHAFTIHVTVLVLLKGVLYARSSRLIHNLGFRFLVMDLVVVEHVKFLLGTMYSWIILMYNSLSIAIFHFSWKMQSDVWGTVNASNFTHYWW
jgi:photosystem I P700 chlorophyll a apoprotein A1